MVERGADRHRSGSGTFFAKKGHVRVIKNSTMHHGQGHRSLSSSPVKSDGSGRGWCSPDAQKEKGRRSQDVHVPVPIPVSRSASGPSSPRDGSPRSSPSLAYHYAGAKFSEPPSPDVLPKPPMHWNMMALSPRKDQYQEISQQLKMILKVQA